MALHRTGKVSIKSSDHTSPRITSVRACFKVPNSKTFHLTRVAPPHLCCTKVAAAILGGYTGLFVFYKLVSAVSGGKKKAPEPIKVVEVPSSTTGIPDIESPAFEKFVESDAFMKLLENEEQLKGLIEK